MLSSEDLSFIYNEMSIDINSIDQKLNQRPVFEFKKEIESAISEFIKIILKQLKSGKPTNILSFEDNEAEQYINKYACNLSDRLTNESAKEALDSLRHAFASFAFNGLHQLFTRQENEVWYPKIILNEELKPNDIHTLPTQIILYRGTDLAELSTKNYGQSWTTCKKIAEAFAFKHYASQPWFVASERVIIKTIFPRQHVFYSNQSCEFEVAVDIHKIGDVEKCT